MRREIKESHCVVRRRRIAALLSILLCCSSVMVAAEQVPRPGDPRVLTPIQERMGVTITYSCRDLPIDTVLMQLAEQADVDIYKSPKVTGNVTVKVTDVPLDEVLNNILAAHGWTYITTENMIRVMLISEVAIIGERPITRIYRITYADIKEVADSLGKFISKQGKMSYSKGTSNIIVTDTESKIEAIDKFIVEIDRITPQVLVEARIYDITVNEAFDIGVDWTAGRNVPFTTVERGTTHTRTDEQFPPYSEETTVTDNPVYKQAVDGFGDPMFDSEGNPILEIDPDESVWKTETVGKHIPPTAWGVKDTETITKTDKSWLLDEEGEHLGYTRRSKPFVGGRFVPGEGGALRFGIINDMVDIEFVLNILHSELEAKLLANPRVLVLDNETATFKIVREIPYQEQAQIVAGGAFAEIEFKEVGVELQVTPHITRDGMIRLHIAPEFGIVIELNPEGAPTVDTRKAETTLLVKDGQTVVLGGLRKRETTKGVDKVPVLGDMPLLGGLFRSETETETTNELVVFITTRIITEPSLSETEARQLTVTEFAGPEPTKTKMGGSKK